MIAASDPPPTPPVTEECLTRAYDPGVVNIKAVIIMPDPDVFTAKKAAILACAQAYQNRLGVGSWTVLYYHDVTPTNLTNLYSRPGLKYIYWSGHANSHVGKDERNDIDGVQRTNCYAWRFLHEHMFWWDSYEQIGAFSFTSQTFSGYPTLPSNWDNRGFDLCTIYMTDHADRMAYTNNKKIVFVDGCLSALYTDMAWAYGMFSGQSSSNDQIYIGWDIATIPSSEPIGALFLGDTVNGIKTFWERMGRSESPYNNVWDAFYYVEVHGGLKMRKTLFGELNACFDGGTGDDHIRIMGNGNLHNMRLEP